MSEPGIPFTVDGIMVVAQPGQTIIQACDEAGIYIPRLCYRPELPPGGECRLCTCKVNGRHAAACVTPPTRAAVVENDSPELNDDRRMLVEMLFVEGNHFCPSCEKSGDCDLQAMAYRLGLEAMELPYQWPAREIDATHPDIFIDRNTCILCGLCIRASQADGKSIFGYEGRGTETRIIVDSKSGLAGTDIETSDKAAKVCPVGCIVVKGGAPHVRYGERRFDREPIGSEIEARRKPPRGAAGG